MGDDGSMQRRDHRRSQQKPRPARPFAPQHSRPYVHNRRQPMHQQEQWPRYSEQQQAPNSSETLVHFHKSFGVMQEIFEHPWFMTLGDDLHNLVAEHTLPGMVPCPSFLDLGCAPGGFSACLLQDDFLGPNSVGYGVSLPYEQGGFEMLYPSDRLFVQLQDILTLQKEDLLCADNSVDLCLGDAQYLSCLFKNKQSYPSRTQQYRGVKVKSKALGIWSLTVKECSLAFSKLRHGGSFIFRFGWRGIGSGDAGVHPSGEQVAPDLLEKYLHEEEWYKALTHWLFSVLKSLFGTLKPFKSEYVHQADVSFYMVCRGFDRTKYEQNNWEAKLDRAFSELGDCEDEALLIKNIKNQISAECKADIDDLLEVVGRMRAIGIESRKVTNPTALKKWEDPNGPNSLKIADEKSKQNGSREVTVPESTTVPAPPAPSEGSTTAESSNASSSSVPQVIAPGSTKVPAPPAPSEGSTTAESSNASSSSVPQVPDVSNGNAPDRREKSPDNNAPDTRENGKSVEHPIDSDTNQTHNIPAEEPCGPASIARSSATILGSTSGAGGSTSSTGGVKGSVRKGTDSVSSTSKARGRGARKQNWEGSQGSQWMPPMSYEYGVPASNGNWAGNGRYFSIAEQVVATNNVDPSYAAMEAEEAYRRQMQFTMFQSHMSEPQFVDGGNFQSQMQWPQGQILQDSSLQQVALNGLRTSECTDWPASHMDVNYGHPWMGTSGVEDCVAIPGPRNPDVLELSRLVNRHEQLQQTAESWHHTMTTGSVEMPFGLEPTIPAVGSSTPAVDSSNQVEPVAANPGNHREGTTSALSEVLPSLLSLPVKRRQAANNSTSDREETTHNTNQSSDSDSSYEDYKGSGRYRQHRHKRRAGRLVRERRYGRRKRNGFSYPEDGIPLYSQLLKLKVLLVDIIGALPRGDIFVQAMRCGLFCAMAWSVNSIIFSSVQLYRTEMAEGELLANATVEGGVSVE